jgi:hypothetical protein
MLEVAPDKTEHCSCPSVQLVTMPATDGRSNQPIVVFLIFRGQKHGNIKERQR